MYSINSIVVAAAAAAVVVVAVALAGKTKHYLQYIAFDCWCWTAALRQLWLQHLLYTGTYIPGTCRTSSRLLLSIVLVLLLLVHNLNRSFFFAVRILHIGGGRLL